MRSKASMIAVIVPPAAELLRQRIPANATPNELRALKSFLRKTDEDIDFQDDAALHRLTEAVRQEYIKEELRKSGPAAEEEQGFSLDWTEMEADEEPAHCLPAHLCKKSLKPVLAL